MEPLQRTALLLYKTRNNLQTMVAYKELLSLKYARALQTRLGADMSDDVFEVEYPQAQRTMEEFHAVQERCVELGAAVRDAEREHDKSIEAFAKEWDEKD